MTISYKKPMYFDTTVKAQKQLSSSVADDLGLILNSVVGNTVTLGHSDDNSSNEHGVLNVNRNDGSPLLKVGFEGENSALIYGVVSSQTAVVGGWDQNPAGTLNVRDGNNLDTITLSGSTGSVAATSATLGKTGAAGTATVKDVTGVAKVTLSGSDGSVQATGAGVFGESMEIGLLPSQMYNIYADSTGMFIGRGETSTNISLNSDGSVLAQTATLGHDDTLGELYLKDNLGVTRASMTGGGAISGSYVTLGGWPGHSGELYELDGDGNQRVALLQDGLQIWGEGGSGQYGRFSTSQMQLTTSSEDWAKIYRDEYSRSRFTLRNGPFAIEMYSGGADYDSALQIGPISISVGSGFGARQIQMDGGTVTGLNMPVNNSDAASKYYVDSVAQGLDVKASCVAATTEPLPACTYDNGNDGVGATLTGDVAAALPAQDAVAPSTGARLLVKDQLDPTQNGIYVITDVGGEVQPWVLTRAIDMDKGEQFPGAFTFIEGGATLNDTGWVCVSDAPVEVGTTPIDFVQFSSAGIILAGDGLVKSGNTIAVQPLLNGSSENVSGLSATAQGLSIDLAAVPGLEILADDGLAVKTDAKTLAFNSDGALFAGAKFTKGTNAATNKVVVFSANGTVDVAATPATAGAGNVAGIVASTNGSDAYVVQSGVLPGALSSATAGTAYFMGDDGALTTSLPSAGRVIQVGIAANETDLYVQIRDLGTLIAA